MLAPQAHGKSLELMAWIDADVASIVNGDRGRLRQVLTNLISNAVKFTEAGEVTVARAQRGRGRCRFDVTDTGIGITRAAHRRGSSTPSPRPTRRPPAATAAPASAWPSRASSSS